MLVGRGDGDWRGEVRLGQGPIIRGGEPFAQLGHGLADQAGRQHQVAMWFGSRTMRRGPSPWLSVGAFGGRVTTAACMERPCHMPEASNASGLLHFNVSCSGGGTDRREECNGYARVHLMLCHSVHAIPFTSALQRVERRGKPRAFLGNSAGLGGDAKD